MNLTQIIEETGKRIRIGKSHADKLTNAEIKEVIEIALNVVEQGLQEGTLGCWKSLRGRSKQEVD